jgi:hypothetical protein
VSTAYQIRPETPAGQRRKVCNVGESIVSRVEPPRHGQDNESSPATPLKSYVSFFKQFFSSNWPPGNLSAHQWYDQPRISIGARVQDFFRSGYRSTSLGEYHRIIFQLKTTSMHDFTGCYSLWLSLAQDEPLWSVGEMGIELAWSLRGRCCRL